MTEKNKLQRERNIGTFKSWIQFIRNTRVKHKAPSEFTTAVWPDYEMKGINFTAVSALIFICAETPLHHSVSRKGP